MALTVSLGEKFTFGTNLLGVDMVLLRSDRFFIKGPRKDKSSLYYEFLPLVHFKVGRGDFICSEEDV